MDRTETLLGVVHLEHVHDALECLQPRLSQDRPRREIVNFQLASLDPGSRRNPVEIAWYRRVPWCIYPRNLVLIMVLVPRPEVRVGDVPGSHCPRCRGRAAGTRATRTKAPRCGEGCPRACGRVFLGVMALPWVRFHAIILADILVQNDARRRKP